MLKLLIVDDERVIRETISRIIDWNKYDIEVAGLCQNGIEAYDMILDESPEIVLTDVKMPGMNGLELIKRVRSTDLSTQFIIISGYGEFEYAKEAMKYGVKHYLLKPCNEKQILECVEACKKDYYQSFSVKIMREQQAALQKGMLYNVISSVINDCLCQNIPLERSIPEYEQYFDFYSASWKVFYIYYLEYVSLPEFLQSLKDYCARELPGVILYGVYVTNVLVLFFRNPWDDSGKMAEYLAQTHLKTQEVGIEPAEQTFPSLEALLRELLNKVKRFGMIYYINDYHISAICNYNAIISRIQVLYARITENGGDDARQYTGQMAELLNGIENPDFLRQLAGSLFLKMTSDTKALTAAEVAEWIMSLEQEQDIVSLRDMIVQKLLYFSDAGKTAAVSSMTRQIRDYVEQHLNDPGLMLKQIAENRLFMNADYVSKRFYKENGVKFSQYLTNRRIQKAKKLILSDPDIPIREIAEQVGCGKNPQYFSHLFKKQTGITPTEFINSVYPNARLKKES